MKTLILICLLSLSTAACSSAPKRGASDSRPELPVASVDGVDSPDLPPVSAKPPFNTDADWDAVVPKVEYEKMQDALRYQNENMFPQLEVTPLDTACACSGVWLKAKNDWMICSSGQIHCQGKGAK